MKQLTLSIAVMMGLLVSTSVAQDHKDQKQHALQLVAKVSQTYSTLTSYYLEATSISDDYQDESRQLSENPIILAEIKPNKRHWELKNPFGGAAQISDGTTTWEYLVQNHQFSTSAAPVGKPSQDLASYLPEDHVTRYAKLAETVNDVHIAGSETLTFEGKPVDCALLEFTTKPDTNKPHGKTPLSPVWRKVWVDKTRFWVLQESWKDPEINFVGVTMRSTKTIVFKTIRLNQPIADSVFAFVPPKSALEVEEIFAPGSQRAAKVIGKDAPGLALPALDGTITDIKDLRGKTVLLYVWATWCVPCHETAPIVKKANDRWKDKGLAVLAIDRGENKDVVASYLAKHPAAGTVLLDEKNVVAGSFDTEGLPTLVIISKDGKIVYKSSGFGDTTETDLMAALKGQGFE